MCEEDVQEGPSRQETRLALRSYLMKVLQMKRGRQSPQEVTILETEK